MEEGCRAADTTWQKTHGVEKKENGRGRKRKKISPSHNTRALRKNQSSRLTTSGTKTEAGKPDGGYHVEPRPWYNKHDGHETRCKKQLSRQRCGKLLLDREKSKGTLQHRHADLLATSRCGEKTAEESQQVQSYKLSRRTTGRTPVRTPVGRETAELERRLHLAPTYGSRKTRCGPNKRKAARSAHEVQARNYTENRLRRKPRVSGTASPSALPMTANRSTTGRRSPRALPRGVAEN